MALATHATVIVPGVPPAWPNTRMGHMQRHSEMSYWKRTAWYLAHSARNRAHWPLPVRTDPPALRWVRFDIHRVHLLDTDNAWASIKPVLDGLHWPGEGPANVGPLLVDDSAKWCCVWAVEQHKAPSAAAEQVVVSVHLVDPRPGPAGREGSDG